MEKTKGGQLTDDEVRRKDAIYFAFAISSDSLGYHKYVSQSTFHRLLTEQFVNDVKNPDPRCGLSRPTEQLLCGAAMRPIAERGCRG